MSKHTPGPWFNCGEGHVKSKHETIAWVSGEANLIRSANTALIAAAPEMFELLKDANEWIESIADENNQAFLMFKEIQSLIKRIEGV